MRKQILRLFWMGCGLFLFGGMIGLSLLVYFSFGLPKVSSLADYRPPIPSQILAQDGTVLASVGIAKRDVATMDEIPKKLIDAFLSAEDSSFYAHKGVDYLGILRALIADIKAGKIVQGGSTITQQVAKSLLLSKEKSIVRKIKDFLLAQRIEKRFTKEEILYLYMNQMYFGGGFYGVKAAFRGYFNKEMSEATIAECAMIAGLLAAPSKYSPYVNPKFAKKRQEYVLSRMLATKKISSEEYLNALAEKIRYRIRKNRPFKAGYFTEWVRQRVIELVGEEKFLRDGFKVETTLDWELQKIAQKQVQLGIKAIDKRQGFKGPHRHFEDSDEIRDFEMEFRKKLIKERCQYFTLDESGERVYELEFDEEEFYKIKEDQMHWKKNLKSRRFVQGFAKDDSFNDYLKVGEMYEAVVQKVENWGRIIYVSIGGVSGIIPYSGFRWAHERVISEEHKYYPFVQRPSTIVKPGDVIWVTIRKSKAPLLGYAHKDFVNSIKKGKDYKKIVGQKYLLCDLDQIPETQGALISLKPKNGEIVAFVGGYDFAKTQFNRAIQSLRQPGSSFKPILFAAGLENGFTPASIILDSPEALGGADENLSWKPSNYDGKFKGPITFRNALEQSRNVPTIKIADEMTVPVILDFVDRIQLNAKLDLDLSLALGSFGVTLLDLVSTYALFPNKGKIVEAKSIVSITDREGNFYQIDEMTKSKRIEEKEQLEASMELEKAQSEDKESKEKFMMEKKNPYRITLGGKQVYDSRLAYLMTNLLRGVVQHGTGRRAKDLGQFIGGKTGTTNNYVDAWFIGFSSNMATGVWTGFDDNSTLGWGETGSKSALPIWKEFMRAGLKKFGEHDFPVPSGIVHVAIDKDSGGVSQGDQKSAFIEAFVEGTEPGLERIKLAEDEGASGTETSILEDDDYYSNQ